MPVVEIAWWTASDAFVADKSLITPGLDFLKKVEGCNAYVAFGSSPSVVNER